jgi:methionyl aminopeptidase
MIILKNRDEIGKMRQSGRIAACIREELARFVSPGITTRELDAKAAQLIAAMGAKSAFLAYRGYPGNVCISIDSEVVHGIPGDRRIEIGQIVSLDVGVVFGGFIGDTATTVMVGVTDPEIIRLVRSTELALKAGIEKARAGKRLGDISHAVEATVVQAGFSVVRDFVGHGVGRKLHEDPQIPNFGTAGAGPKLKVGMTLAIEPMVNMGGSGVSVLGDGWTVCTVDGRPSAHFEHTVAICEDGPEILTAV